MELQRKTVSALREHDSSTALAALEGSRPGALSSFSALSAALVERGDRVPYADWYLGSSTQRWDDPAKNAYDNALEILEKELSLDERQAIWLRGKSSMRDVQLAVENAMAEYKNKGKGSKVREWLAGASSRVMYYGSIFDMFASHHPEYVSLAWGTMKFLFIAVLNHEELLVEISKAITRIADVLPRTELHSILYPTPRMQEAVALVYARIIEFILLAVKWYKKGKLMHSLSAIGKPFSIGFKPVIEKITEASRRVDELANAASKAEIRDLHVRVHGLNQTLSQLTEIMAVQQQQQTLHNQTLLTLSIEYKSMLKKGQMDELRNGMLTGDTPASDESLAYCRSMRDRRRQRQPTQIPAKELSKLKAWVSDPESSLLLAQGQGVRTSSLDFAADFLDVVLDRGYPVLWALPSTIGSTDVEEDSVPSISGIIRSLISQALSLNSSVMDDGINPITVKHFRAATTIEQWFGLLQRCTSAFPKLFLVIDTGLIEQAVEHEEAENQYFKASDFIEQMTELVKTRDRGGLKIVIVSWRFNSTTSLDAAEVFDQMQIFTDKGRRAERLMRQPKYRAIARKRNQRFAEALKDSVYAKEY